MATIFDQEQRPKNMTKSDTTKPDNSPKDELTEQLLVYLALCKLGDRTAFEQLYQLCSAKLNGIAYRMTGNIESANAALQACFIQVWQQRKQYEAHKCEPFTWLVNILRVHAYQHLRHNTQQILTNNTDNDIDDYYNAFGEFDPINSAKEPLSYCLAKLEQKQSKAILLAYLYGYSRVDIALYFDVPINTAKSWLRRGMARLQLCLNH
jgi:RNA polymerase sigma-70 factor, ECF subfamily